MNLIDFKKPANQNLFISYFSLDNSEAKIKELKTEFSTLINQLHKGGPNEPIPSQISWDFIICMNKKPTIFKEQIFHF